VAVIDLDSVAIAWFADAARIGRCLRKRRDFERTVADICHATRYVQLVENLLCDLGLKRRAQRQNVFEFVRGFLPVRISGRSEKGSPTITVGVYGHLFSNTNERATQVVKKAFDQALTDQERP
jgi:hypothetical protein